ncbi:MAG: hypothetical protein NVSMB62_01620 [Acidobacteriaceae bacterium]
MRSRGSAGCEDFGGGVSDAWTCTLNPEASLAPAKANAESATHTSRRVTSFMNDILPRGTARRPLRSQMKPVR